MAAKITAARRREIEQAAVAIRLDGIRRGLAEEEIVSRIQQDLPEVFALEAWRLASGWTRAEVSARIDQLYRADGLAPPAIDATTLCRRELGVRRPGDGGPGPLPPRGPAPAARGRRPAAEPAPDPVQLPGSFSIGEIDGVCRVMLYGHGKRGTQGPIITFADGSAPHQYFVDQIRWLEQLATGDTPDPWASKGIVVAPLAV